MPAKYCTASSVDAFLVRQATHRTPAADRSAALLAAFKRGRSRAEEKISALDAAVARNETDSALRQHRAVWIAEHERLEVLSTTLDSGMRAHLRAFAARCDPGDYDGVETLEHVDAAVVDLDGADEERDEFAREIAEPVEMALQQLRRVRKEASRTTSRQECLQFLNETRARLDAIKQELDAEYAAAAAESHAANASLHWHRAADNAEARDPWIADCEGKVMRYKDTPCADPDVRAARFEEYESIIAALELHDATSTLDLPALRNDVHTNTTLPHPRVPLSELDEHTCFHIQKLVDEYEGMADVANRGALCAHRIGLEIPILRTADVAIYTRTLTARAHRKHQHAARRRTLTALLTAHLAETPAIFAAANCAVWRAGLAREEFEREDAAAEARHATVAAWRLAQAAKREKEDEAMRSAEAERAEDERLVAERADAARQAHAREIAEYHAERQSMLLEQMTKAAELREAYANHALERSKHNLVRIQHRDSLAVQKHLATAADQARLVRERLAQAARLENLARQVRPEVEADEERARGETESWRSAKLAAAAQAEGEVQDSGRTWRVHGWTAAEVMRDSRLKLSLALHEKGLLQNPYARQMLTRIVDSRARADQKSVIQLI
ncbi:hypothetical protein HDU90_006023 [Geranomyces variabilis]|nr:hypothetical protein HDU90_006023 [Geranomyces variabilis]